jgi:tubulin--tyrosine ligase/tubulin polyglutamylase TTLL9
LIPKIKEYIILSMESVRKKLRTGRAFFELFGYDFIIDGDFVPWLIEVNTNPCLEESSRLLEKYVPRMVNDMLKLTVDVAFPPKKGQGPYNPREINQFTVDGYSNEENMWELVLKLDNNGAGEGKNGDKTPGGNIN